MTTLLILGGTARAAAFSALRAGLSPITADLFRDQDLTAIAPARRVPRERFPGQLLEVATESPSGPWIYTGALENHPALVGRIAADRPLWGNDAATLKAVRDPTLVAATLDAAGFAVPEVRLDPRELPFDGSWVRKPFASAGGYGVVRLEREMASPTAPCYIQRFIEGESLSATFVGTGTGAWLAGATKQLLGHGHAPFVYRGSIGPWPISEAARSRIAGLGQWVAARFGLIGLFGIDLILKDDSPWPVEINPRYTASVEVLELALGRSLLVDHRAACEGARRQEAGSFSRRGECEAVDATSVASAERMLVPKFLSGTPPDTLGVRILPGGSDAERRGRHSHPEHGNEGIRGPCRKNHKLHASNSTLLSRAGEQVPISTFIAKEVIYAKAEATFRVNVSPIRFEPFAVPEIADIPEIGSHFDRGDPILTVFATGSTIGGCLEALAARKAEWSRLTASEDTR